MTAATSYDVSSSHGIKSRSESKDVLQCIHLSTCTTVVSIPECECLYPNVVLSISEGGEVSSGTRRLSYA